MGFSRQEYWSGLVFPTPGDLSHPGIKPMSPALAGRFFTTVPPWKLSRMEWGMWNIPDIAWPTVSDGLVQMGLHWLFLSVPSGPVTGFHLSIAKWKFLHVFERLLNFCMFSVVMIFFPSFVFTHFSYGMFRYIQDNEPTPCVCYLVSITISDILISHIPPTFPLLLLKSFWCRYLASCYLLVSYIEPYKIANVGQNLELQNRNFILFNLTLYCFSLKETPYTYQTIFLTPREDLPPNVQVHLITYQLYFSPEACLPLFLNSSHSGV